MFDSAYQLLLDFETLFFGSTILADPLMSHFMQLFNTFFFFSLFTLVSVAPLYIVFYLVRCLWNKIK